MRQLAAASSTTVAKPQEQSTTQILHGGYNSNALVNLVS